MTEPIRVLHVFGALDSGGVSNFVMNAYRRAGSGYGRQDLLFLSCAKPA